jgi:hypothetical protein
MIDWYIIIIILLLILIAYLILKKNFEHFDISDNIKQAVAEQYNIDIDAMRNLAQIANSISNNDTLILPANTTKFGGADSTGNIIANNLSTNRLNVSGSVTFNYSDNNNTYINIFPTGTILFRPFGDVLDIPLGWAPCDGNKYIINTTPNREINFIESDNGTKTPDLRPFNSVFESDSKTLIRFIIKIK